MKVFLIKLLQKVQSILLPWLWAVGRKTWRAALQLVDHYNEIASLTKEEKQALAEQQLILYRGVPEVVARRVIQLAYNYREAQRFVEKLNAPV